MLAVPLEAADHGKGIRCYLFSTNVRNPSMSNLDYRE
jgi:hypothetical protein